MNMDTFHYAGLLPQCQALPDFVESLIERARPLALSAMGARGAQKLGGGPLPVSTILVEDLRKAPYGLFMSAWPQWHGDHVYIYYLQDWTLSIALQHKVFGFAWKAEPALERAFYDRSRLEVGIMNDVLQCFVLDPPAGTYSMIRHHALMLFEATLWLEPEKKTRWVTLYKNIAVRAQETWPRENLQQYLQNRETVAFEIFQERREESLVPRQLQQLLSNPEVVKPVLDYLEAAAVAVGVLAWGYSRVIPEEQDQWLRQHIWEHHRHSDYQLAAMERFLYYQDIKLHGEW